MLHRYALALGLLVCFFLPACSLLGTDEDSRDRLDTYRDVWDARDLSNYRYELHRTCFCTDWLYPAVVEVRHDTVAAVFDPESGDPLRNPRTGDLARETAPYAHLTVDDLFDVVERAIEEDYHRLKVEYNHHLGYPKEIDLERAKGVADDRATYAVEEFTLE